MPRFSVLLSLAALLVPVHASAFGQATEQSTEVDKPAARVTQAVDDAVLAPLANRVHPLVSKAVDKGPVDSGLALDRLTLVLKRTVEQQNALTKLLADQQNAASPNFHRWLTPKEFGERFGVADSDIQQVKNWLESRGFTVTKVANGRDFIEFSGSAAQVSSAFHTSIHRYLLNGEDHVANSTTLAVPAALGPVVAGISSLHDFRKTPLHYDVKSKVVGFKGDGQSQPAITFDANTHGLVPADFASIYNSQGLINSGINGQGQTIAVVGRSNINPATLANFRTIFGLGTGSSSIVLNGPDPGVLFRVGVPCTTQSDCGERDEALLDNEWTAAVAPGATIKFVVSQSTQTADGVDLSERDIIDNNLADVMTESFGGCEANALQADADAITSAAMKAAAEGITYLVSSGDSGAAGCANPGSAVATGANATPSVNILASSPFTLAVGGTEFNEGCTIGADGVTRNCTKYAQFWTSINEPSNSPIPFLSAIGYIPEGVWNEACPTATTGSAIGCGAAAANLFAAGGGASQFFPKPTWQQLAISGIPAADHRYLPDVSLSASGHDFYLVCLSDSDCVPDSTGRFSLAGIAGTSASAPAFAGIMALVDQKMGYRQGQANAVLYHLAAAENYALCNGSSQAGAPASNCIFNDVTTGNNAVPGEAGYGTTSASYQAAAGYDQASGLGSVNIANLVNQWTSSASTPTTVALMVTPSALTRGTNVTLTATVTGVGGTPTGTLAFESSGGGTLANSTLVDGVATFTTPFLPVGTFTMTAHYLGDAIFTPSLSPPVPISVSSTTTFTTNTTLTTTTPNIAAGQTAAFRVTVTRALGTGTGSVPTGLVALVDALAGGAPHLPSSFTPLSSDGTASINVANMAAGSHVVIALYAGDATYEVSQSTSVAVTVSTIPGTYTLSANPGTVTLATKGSGGNATLTVSPANGFTGAVNLACTIAGPPGAAAPTCAVPASVSVTSANAATATITFASIAASAKRAAVTPRSGPAWLAMSGVAFAGVVFLGFPRRRRNWGLMVALLIMAAVAGGIGCGGGGSTTPVQHNAGTTAGTYTATITGTSGSQTVSTTLAVVVP